MLTANKNLGLHLNLPTDNYTNYKKFLLYFILQLTNFILRSSVYLRIVKIMF